jgi:hypothetical protein
MLVQCHCRKTVNSQVFLAHLLRCSAVLPVQSVQGSKAIRLRRICDAPVLHIRSDGAVLMMAEVHNSSRSVTRLEAWIGASSPPSCRRGLHEPEKDVSISQSGYTQLLHTLKSAFAFRMSAIGTMPSIVLPSRSSAQPSSSESESSPPLSKSNA